MIKIRLQRYGTKKQPFYRVVAANARNRRDGRFIEQLGYYDPIRPGENGEKVRLNSERIQYWISKGAQPTETVRGLLKKNGVMQS